MPPFRFKRIPSKSLYEKVINLFIPIHNQKDLNEPFEIVIKDDVLEELRPRLKLVYRKSDWEKVIPQTWCRRVAIQVLRHFLRSRNFILKSNLARINNTTVRVYYCIKADLAVPPKNTVIMAKRISNTRQYTKELFEDIM